MLPALRCHAAIGGFFIAPAFSQRMEGLGPHLSVRGLALQAATHVPRVVLSLLCRFESDLVSLVYSVEVDYGSQLAKDSSINGSGLLGLIFVEGKQAAKSSEKKFLLRFGHNYPSQMMLSIRGIQVAAASTLAAFDGIFWHMVSRQPQSAAALEVAERWISFFCRSSLRLHVFRGYDRAPASVCRSVAARGSCI